MISHKYKFIFLHIPKCAGTSIEFAFGHHGDSKGKGGQDHRTIRNMENPIPFFKTITSLDNMIEILRRIRFKYKTKLNPNSSLCVSADQFENYFKFTFVRNPWSRAFSYYKRVVKDESYLKRLKAPRNIEFGDLLKRFAGKGIMKPQTYWLKDSYKKINLDFIGRFESLETDFASLCSKLSLENITLPHMLKGTGENYKDYYDSKSIDLISQVYKEDIETFKYEY